MTDALGLENAESPFGFMWDGTFDVNESLDLHVEDISALAMQFESGDFPSTFALG